MEFENLQIEVPMVNDENSQYLGIKVYEKKYHNTSKDFVIGFDPNSKEFVDRRKRRAKRFGEQVKERQRITAEIEPEDARLSNHERFLRVELKTLKWPPIPEDQSAEIRHDALLLYGVDHMSTKDVFDYFKLFGPETIEWIDDFSCNVIWDDEASVLNAFDNLSKTFVKLLELQRLAAAETNPSPVVPPPIIIKEEEKEEVDDAVLVEDEEQVDPRDIWRVALPYKQSQLYLRLATINDKKLPGAAQRSEYYLRYGKTENIPPVPGVLSTSRKRKLQQMQKLAVERFKTKEPDVKIVELAELKAEGIISKMEVDEEAPIVKRLNVHHDSDSSEEIEAGMTMVADRVEVQQRLGARFAAPTVHDRLGTPLSDDSDINRAGGIHDRLEEYSIDRIARRNNKLQADARDEIHNTTTRTRFNNQNYVSCEGYIDKYGDYHDIYRADDMKDEKEDKKALQDELATEKYSRERDRRSPRSDNRNHSVRDRLGSTREEGSAPMSDLRDKLRRREKSTPEEPIKDEGDGEKLNLCIEIKREPEDTPMEEDLDEESEFEF